MDKIAYPSTEERRAEGLAARERAPSSSHIRWRPAADRSDPVALLEEQDSIRTPGLVPVRQFVKAVRSGRLEALEGV